MTSNITASDNMGWDTVFAIYYEAANQAIVADKTSPPNFDIPASSGNTSSASGNFGAWQITAGGGAENVMMNLPVTDGVFNDSGTAYSFSGTAQIMISMTYVESAESTGGTNGTLQNLVVQSQNSPSDPPASINQIIYDPSSQIQTGSDQDFELVGMFKEWLNANLSDFMQVFATVNINAQSAKGVFQWLQPTTTSYAFSDLLNDPDHEGIIGVLCMTENRSDEGLSQEIDTAAISSPTATSSFNIAQARFIDQLLIPNLSLLFSGASTSDFTVVQDGTQVTNVNEVTFLQMTTPDGNVMKPTLAKGNFTLTLMDTSLELQFVEVSYSYQEGVTIKFNYTSYATLSLDANGHLQMTETKNSIDGSVVTSKADMWEPIATSVAISVAGAVLGGALGSAFSAAVSATATTATEMAIESTYLLAAVASQEPELLADATVANIQAAADDATAVVDGVTESAAQSPGWLARSWPKILGSIIGGAIGGGIGSVPAIIKGLDENEANNPDNSLNSFAEQAIAPVQWPNTSNYTLNNATLNGTLQLSGTFETNS